MSIVRYRGWPQLNRFHTELNRLLDAPSGHTGWRPSVDIRELEDQYTITVDLPGVALDDIDVTVEKNVLSISGERKTRESQEEQGYVRFERHDGAFSRQFTLPDNVDSEGVSASSNNGVLVVSIPKAAQAQPRKISIAAA